MIVGGSNTLNIRITSSTTYFLNIIDEGTGRRHMVDAVDITDIYSHTESFCGNNHPFHAFLKFLYNSGFLFFVFLAIIRSHQTPVGRTYPGFYTHVYATCKGIVEQCFMSVEKVFHTFGYDTLFSFVVSFSLLQRKLPDIKTDILTLHRTDIKHTGLHLQRTDSFEYHIIATLGIPYGSGSQRKQGKCITEILLQGTQITPQKPVVHTKLFAPGGYRMRLINNNHTNTAVAYEVFYIIRKQQFRREIKQIDLTFTHCPVNFHFLLRRKVGRCIRHTLIAQILQALYLIDYQSL